MLQPMLHRRRPGGHLRCSYRQQAHDSPSILSHFYTLILLILKLWRTITEYNYTERDQVKKSIEA